MDKNQLYNLKNQVIKAFVDHELGNPLKMSDKLYDEKLSQIKAEDPNFNIYEFTPNAEDGEYVAHRSGMTDLEKVHIHDIENHWNFEEGVHKSPKYDGSSVVIYYTNGKFTRVVSMRDKEAGIDQTDKFKEFVPQEVSPYISYIRCECLIDARLDKNARGKANGLVNSKYKQDEVNELATLMAFCAHDLNGDQISWDEFQELKKYNKIRENGIPYFYVTPQVHELAYESGFTMYQDAHVNFRFAIDGIVYYERHFAYKYDYINSEITTVEEIEWKETDRELLFATVWITPVEFESATVSKVSSNGVANLVNLGLDEGAVVEVARSGETIPQIINVVEPVEVKLPKCPYCGHQMTLDDLCGSGLLCTNEDCSGKIDRRKSHITEWMTNDGKDSVIKFIKENIESVTMDTANVSRFNYDAKRLVSEEEIKDKLTEFYESNNFDGFRTYLGDAYNWSELAWDEFWFKAKATFIAIHDLIFINK